MSDQGIGTTTIAQIAVVVRNIEQAARTYADVLNLPLPKIVITDKEEVTHAKYRGVPTQGRAKLILELLESVPA